MTYRLETFDMTGRRTGELGPFGNIASARQAMLDHSDTINTPTEPPFQCAHIQIVEGWFIGRTEYNIIQQPEPRT